MLFDQMRPAADEPAVDQRAKHRAQLHALKLPQAEEQEGERYADGAADAVVSGFAAVNLQPESAGYLLDEQLVGLGRQIGVEQKGNAQREITMPAR